MRKNVPTAEQKVLTAQFINDDGFRRFLGYMPNPDDVAVGSIEAYSTYREMRTDPRVKSLLNKLKTSALNYPVRLSQPEGCSDEVFSFIQSQPLFSSNLYGKMKRMLSAIDYGFSISEVVWKSDGAAWIPENIITRKPERFVFDNDWNAFWRKSGGEKVLLDQKYKWLTFRHNPDDENPYGTSDLRSVYWPWMFKKAGYEFWLMATEKFSVKTILALFEMSGGDEVVKARAQTLADLLSGVASGSATALGNVKDIKELGMSGDLSGFSALVDACDVQIAYGLTGQSLASNNPTAGTQALGTVHADMLQTDAKGIAQELQQILQKAVNWAIELNWGPDATPPVFEFDMEQRATLDEVMKAIDHEVPVSQDALYDFYKLPRPKDDEDTFLKPTLQLAAAPMAASQLDPIPGTLATTSADIQSTAMNGAQVQSLVDLAAQVSAGTIPVETARGIAAAAFPLVKPEELDRVFNPLKGFKPKDVTLSDPAKKKVRRPAPWLTRR